MSRLLKSIRSNKKSRRVASQRRKALRCESLEARVMFNADMGDLSGLNDEFDDAGGRLFCPEGAAFALISGLPHRFKPSVMRDRSTPDTRKDAHLQRPQRRLTWRMWHLPAMWSCLGI